ncbi:MAG TPA: hypothetical protein VGG32_07890 [Thermoplasmata archaeon]
MRVEPWVHGLLLASIMGPEDVEELEFEVLSGSRARVQLTVNLLQRLLDSPVLVEHQFDQQVAG